MANNVVTKVTTQKGTIEDVALALEVAIEAVDDAKAIHLVSVHHVGGNQFQGIFLHAT